MSLIPCGNCGWMCNDRDVTCNMCGLALRGLPLPPPISMNHGVLPSPEMARGQPPAPPILYPAELPVLGRLLSNRLRPESELADNPRLECIDCGEIVGNRPRTCPRCGLAPDQDSIHARQMREKIARAMSLCEGVRAWTTFNNSASEAVWVQDTRLLKVLHDCLKLDGSVRADSNSDEIVARLEIRVPGSMCVLTFDAQRGRVGGGGPTHDHDWRARLIQLEEPRRIFRWLTWVGLQGLERYTH